MRSSSNSSGYTLFQVKEKTNPFPFRGNRQNEANCRLALTFGKRKNEANCWELLHIQCVPYFFWELEKRSQPGSLFRWQILQNEAMPELQPLPDAFAMIENPGKGQPWPFCKTKPILEKYSDFITLPTFPTKAKKRSHRAQAHRFDSTAGLDPF